MKLTLTLTSMLFVITVGCHSATRTVTLTWAEAANSVPVTFNILRCQATSPNGCTPSIVINSSPVTATEYADNTAVVGLSYQYGVQAVASPCTQGNTGPCGASTVTVDSEIIYIPPRPIGPSPTKPVTLTITGLGIVAVIQ